MYFPKDKYNVLPHYGVGEKNSQEYGQPFLETILEFNGGIMK